MLVRKTEGLPAGRQVRKSGVILTNCLTSGLTDFGTFGLFFTFKICAMSTKTNTDKIKPTATDFLPLQGTDYVEFYVGNAKQAAHFYKTAFGFQSLAYAGPETGIKDRASYAVRQHKLTFVFTTALRKGNAIAEHIHKHGDGVKVLALRVDDATCHINTYTRYRRAQFELV